MQVKSIISQLCWITVILIVLMIPAIYNAFPLVTSDSGTYIRCGFEGTVPIDRPLFYGLFVRFFSFKINLMWPIIVQNLILAVLLYKLYNHFLTGANNRMIYFFITLLICACTGVAWFSAQLMADVFIGISFLSFALLLLKPTQRTETGLLILFFIMGVISHNSHLLIFGIFSALILICVGLNLFSLKNYIPLKRVYMVLFLSLFAWFINPAINLIYEGKFKQSGSPYAFFAAKYAENGILKEYLKEKCIAQANNNHHVIEGTYFIKNLHSNLFLDVESYSMKAGAKIHQWEYTGVENQKFLLEKQQNQLVKLVSVKSGKYVTAYVNAEGKLALKQDNDLKNKSQLFELVSDTNSAIVSIKLIDRNVYLGSDTLNRAFGMQFIEGNNPAAMYCRYQLVSAANCFCYFKDSIPNGAMEFLWADRSILSRTGNWDFHEKEYKKVMQDIIFSSAYFGRNLNAAITATYTQLKQNDTGDGIAKYDTNSSPYISIKKYFPESTTAFLESRENVGLLDFIFLNFINANLMNMSLIIFILVMALPFLRRKITPGLLILSCMAVLMLIINAFVTGAMANILDRLQSRISWILPLMVLMMIYNIAEHYERRKTNEGN